jgi:hypothetical protein
MAKIKLPAPKFSGSFKGGTVIANKSSTTTPAKTTTSTPTKTTTSTPAKTTSSNITMTNGMNNAQLANAMMATGGTSSPLYAQVTATNKASSASKPTTNIPAPSGPVSYLSDRGPTTQLNPTFQSSMPTASTMPMTMPTTTTSNNASSLSSRLSNTGQVLNAAFNPFSKTKIEADFKNPTVNKIVELMANNPYSTALTATGIYGITKGIASSIASATSKTAVSTLSKVGVKQSLKIGAKTAGNIASNAVTEAKTTSWLMKLGMGLGGIALLKESIGTYPFAGFLKEEALQTLGFATKTALDNNDLEGARNAQNMIRETLDPSIWDKIKAGIPFVNVLDSLNNYYEAARLKMTVDDKIIADRQIQLDTGETDFQYQERIKNEEATDYKQNIDYYNQERMKLIEWERQAQIEARNQDAEFWRREREKTMEMEKKDREAIAEFWEAYKKRAQKIADDSRPSKLRFGII